MAKPKSPLLSLGARGTIADRLTFQKRGTGHFARVKPIPKDPRSEAQLAWRQVYRDAVAAWNALSQEEKEAWRGVCPGLTAYQCFMSSELKYVPPITYIDIGAEPIDRAQYALCGWTFIDKNNPANASGTLHTIKIYAEFNIRALIVGTFYTINPLLSLPTGAAIPDSLRTPHQGVIVRAKPPPEPEPPTHKCRDSVFIGDVEAGAERTFTELSIDVQEGDYIGCFFIAGSIEADSEGFAGYWYAFGEHIDPGDEAEYLFYDGNAISLYGIGEPTP